MFMEFEPPAGCRRGNEQNRFHPAVRTSDRLAGRLGLELNVPVAILAPALGICGISVHGLSWAFTQNDTPGCLTKIVTPRSTSTELLSFWEEKMTL